MKKSSISIFSILLGSIILFSGCENFLSGTDLKNTIDTRIKIANAKEHTIELSIINLNAGRSPQEGNLSLKEDVPTPISFAVNSDYAFYKWMAFKKSDLAEFTDGSGTSGNFFYTNQINSNYLSKALDESIVSFTKPSELSTEVIVKKYIDDILIVPVCYRRPYVIGYTDADPNRGIDYKHDIQIIFNTPLSDGVSDTFDVTKYRTEQLFHTYDLYSGGKLFYTYDLPNPDLVKIVAKPTKYSLQSSPMELYFKGRVSKNILLLSPIDITGSAYDFIEQNGPKRINSVYGDSYVSSYYADQTTTRYIEITLPASLKDEYGIPMGHSYTLTIQQSLIPDNEPPVIRTSNFYFPDRNMMLSNSYSYQEDFGKTDYKLYNLSDVYNGTVSKDGYGYYTTPSIEQVATESRFHGGSYNIEGGNSKRIKNSLVYFADAVDSESAEKMPTSSEGVKSFIYDIYRLSDNKGNKNDRYASSLMMYRKYLPTGGVSNDNLIDFVQFSFSRMPSYMNNYDNNLMKRFSKKYFNSESMTYKDYTYQNGGIGYYFNFNNSDFPDGLYCINIYAKDYYGNSIVTPDANKNKYKITTFKSRFDTDTTNAEYSKHAVQLMFIKDTVAPKTKAEDFILPSKWYTKDTIETFSIPRDAGTKNSAMPYDDPARKIVDDGSAPYNSLYVYRICKILTKEQASNWKVDGTEETGWMEPYRGDYVFEDIYGHGNWLPDDFYEHPENYSVYAYVKDDVNNISEQIKLEGAIKYVPLLNNNPAKVSDSGGTGLQIQFMENGTGLKTIHYDIRDTNGTSYDICKIFTYSANELPSATKNLSNRYIKPTEEVYIIDKDEHTLPFIEPIKYSSYKRLDIYITETQNYNYPYPTTAKLWLENEEGTRSSEITLQLK